MWGSAGTPPRPTLALHRGESERGAWQCGVVHVSARSFCHTLGGSDSHPTSATWTPLEEANQGTGPSSGWPGRPVGGPGSQWAGVPGGDKAAQSCSPKGSWCGWDTLRGSEVSHGDVRVRQPRALGGLSREGA